MGKTKKFGDEPGKRFFAFGVVLLCLGLLNFSGADFYFSTSLYDSLYFFRGETEATRDIVVVAIDEPSFAVTGLRWPWPRSTHAKLIDSLQRAGAKIIVFDILLSEKSTDKEDIALADSIARAGNVALASVLDNADDTLYALQTRVEPYRLFTGAGAKTGVANFPLDNDGFVRRFYLQTSDGRPSLDYLAVRMFDPSLDITPDEESLINFVGQARTIKTVSYYQGLEPEKYLPPGLFKNKLVIVGIGAGPQTDLSTRLPESFPIPFTRFGHGYVPGLDIHAQAMATLLDGRSLQKTAERYNLLAALIFLFVCFFLFYRVTPALTALISFFLCAILYGVTFFLFTRLFIIFDPVPAISSILLCFVVITISRYVYIIREKRKIRELFSRYLAPQVVDQLVTNRIEVDTGGKNFDATILFTDLAGFTSISEKNRPDETFEKVNMYLCTVTDIVFAHGGMIDKFIGDAVMAVFGVPVKSNTHSACGLKAALEIESAIKKLDIKFDGGETLEVRVGLNSGQVLAGNVGGKYFNNYTVMGKEVNLASRLEPINKIYGTSVLAGEATISGGGKDLYCREIDTVAVKGERRGVKIYEPIGRLPDLSPATLDMCELYNSALKLYIQCDFKNACIKFEEIEKKYADHPSHVMALRCRMFERDGVPEGWDGIYRLDVK